MIKTGITPDFITVDGAEGGTGAAPLEFANNVGCPLTEALVFVHNTLTGFGLRAQPGSAREPLITYITMRMPNRGGAEAGTPELYFTDPDGLAIQLQDVKYCGGGGVLGDICP